MSDRQFICCILIPSIRKFYVQDNEKGWRFIKQKCISKVSSVCKNKPDFLNRSVYEIVLERYAEDNARISKEAFRILREFILSRNGIPHKTDLIYQAIVGPKLSIEKNGI